MADVPERREGSRLLGYFGLETPGKAQETFLWASPYMGFLTLALVCLSALVQQFFPLRLWVHVLAIALALLYFFFFLARLRQAGAQSGGTGEGREEDL